MELRVVVSLSDETAALVERLVAALGRTTAAAKDSDDRQPGGFPPASLRAGPRPVPAAEAGAGVAPVEGLPSPPPAPPVAADGAVLSAARFDGLEKARAARWSGETWLTEERSAVMQAGWEAGEDVHALRARLAALPGPAMPGIRALAQKAWVRGWKRPPGYKPLLGRPQPVGEGPAPLPWQTPERLAKMRRLLEEEAASWPRVTEVLSAMPGAAMPQFRESVKRWARQAGIAAPARPATSWRNPARRQVLERDWPAGVDVRAIRATMEALPGLALPPGIVGLGVWANDLGLRRPEGHVGAVNRPLAGWPVMMEPRLKRPAPVQGAMPAGRQPPPLPAPSGETGRVYAPFRAIAAWAGFYGVAYDGGNIDQVNKLRAAKGLAPVVQDDSVPMPMAAMPAEGVAA